MGAEHRQHAHAQTHVHARARASARAHIHINIHIHRHTHIHIHTHTHTHTYTYTYTYTYTRIPAACTTLAAILLVRCSTHTYLLPGLAAVAVIGLATAAGFTLVEDIVLHLYLRAGLGRLAGIVEAESGHTWGVVVFYSVAQLS